LVLIGCLTGLPNPSLYGYGRRGDLGFPPLRWSSWPSGLINEAWFTAPTRPRRPQIKFLSTNHNSPYFIPGMGHATERLPISVILSHYRTNITAFQNYDTPKSSSTSPVAYISFMPYNISFDYMLNIIALVDMAKMDKFFFLNSHDT